MKTLSATPRPYDRWKAETLSFLHELLVWGVILVSSLNYVETEGTVLNVPILAISKIHR